jgi:GNAT superfamily N-acetyltransferase
MNYLFIVVGMWIGAAIAILAHWRSTKRHTFMIKNFLMGTADKYTTLAVSPRGKMLFVQISDRDSRSKELPYGWALIEVIDQEKKVVFLWDIHVREELRRQGYGRDLMNILQENYDEIRTHTYPAIISRAGTQLCLACGFRMTQALIKRDPWLLVWQRGKGVSDKPRGNK